MSYLISDMLQIADEKRLQIIELLRLTEEQTILLAREDAEGLERHVAYKQDIIDRVNSLDARYKELNARVLSEYNVYSLEDIRGDSRVQKLLDTNMQTQNIIRGMLEIDKKNSEMGGKLLEKLGEAVKHAGMAPMVSRAYNSDMPAAFFINRQG